jgi:hypothetical protein
LTSEISTYLSNKKQEKRGERKKQQQMRFICKKKATRNREIISNAEILSGEVSTNSTNKQTNKQTSRIIWENKIIWWKLECGRNVQLLFETLVSHFQNQTLGTPDTPLRTAYPKPSSQSVRKSANDKSYANCFRRKQHVELDL